MLGIEEEIKSAWWIVFLGVSLLRVSTGEEAGSWGGRQQVQMFFLGAFSSGAAAVAVITGISVA